MAKEGAAKAVEDATSRCGDAEEVELQACKDKRSMVETQDERLVKRLAKRVRTEGRMTDRQWGREEVGGVLEALERDPETVDFYVKKQVGPTSADWREGVGGQR